MGVGMPETLRLHEFGAQVKAAFGEWPYHVGSSVIEKTWRDVDVRLILSDEDYDALFPEIKNGDTGREMTNQRWVSLCMAYAALGKQMTGLPIDFQIQRRTQANDKFKVGLRSCLCLAPRFHEQVDQSVLGSLNRSN